MEILSGAKYPNGILKSRLYEVFLCFSHFECDIKDYLHDLAEIHQDEKNKEEICHWYIDFDQQKYVYGLSFSDSSNVLQITENGFRFVPVKRKIFISYAKEDLLDAKRLYGSLKRLGVLPWLDEIDLLPGMKWESEIGVRIGECNFFIALLSSRSVEKRGFVQKEIREALNVLDKCPDNEIYLIPARLDNCKPSHRVLKDIHWVDLFPDWNNGFKKIIKAIGIPFHK
jgi:hypothetical protein